MYAADPLCISKSKIPNILIEKLKIKSVNQVFDNNSFVNQPTTPTQPEPMASIASTPKTTEEKTEPVPNPELEARIASLLEVGEECLTEADLRNLLTKKASFNLYDGFEPSGRMHIAQGVFKAMNVNKCTAAGGTFIFWVADWFALMNDKMGGDLDKIKDVGQYLIEVWTAAGMDMEHVVFKWASDDICAKAAPPAVTEVPLPVVVVGETKQDENSDGAKKKKKKKSKKKKVIYN